MARTKGGTIDTRAALLDSAWVLFQLRGYDAVSVDAIVRHASLSKGTFFHYFATKNDLLEAVCEHISGPPWTALAERVADRSLSALSRLNLLLSGMRQWRLGHIGALVALYRALTRQQNALLFVKLADRQDELFRGALLDVLDQGNRDGVFSVLDVEETARLVSAVARCAGEGNLRQLASARSPEDPGLVEAVERRAKTATVAIERMLGARPGSLARVGTAALKKALRAQRAQDHAGRRSRSGLKA